MSFCSESDLIEDLPVTNITGTAWGQGCTWAIVSRIQGHPPKHCITVRVPEPS